MGHIREGEGRPRLACRVVPTFQGGVVLESSIERSVREEVNGYIADVIKGRIKDG